MLQLLKKIFCLHIYEYQQMEEIWGRLGMPQMWYPKRLKNTARKSERYAHFFISIIFNLNSYLLKSLPVPHDEKA